MIQCLINLIMKSTQIIQEEKTLKIKFSTHRLYKDNKIIH